MANSLNIGFAATMFAFGLFVAGFTLIIMGRLKARPSLKKRGWQLVIIASALLISGYLACNAALNQISC